MSDTIIEWDERLSLGIEAIDTQHKKLLEMTNTLYASCLESEEKAAACFRSTMHGAVDYVRYHFGFEEKMLRLIAYPFFDAHKAEHEDFVREILRNVREFESGGRFVPNGFVRYLREWILSHIAYKDKQYVSCFFDAAQKIQNQYKQEAPTPARTAD